MALQSQNLVMVGLGIAQDSPPNAMQPPLVDGVHLRWSFPPGRGFPWYGFYLLRRLHRVGTPIFLSSALGNLQKGPLPGTTLTTPYGQISSDKPLVLTDDFPPSGLVEFDLDGRAYTRFTLATEQVSRRTQASIGLRARPGDPPITKTCVDFSSRTPGAGPNPDTEQGITFEALDIDGKPLPVSHILAVPGTGTQITGFDCKWSLTITLPTPATYIQATLTPMTISATVQAYNADGTSAGSATTQNPRGRTPETLTITGSAITHIVIQPHGESPNAGGDHTLLHQFCFGTGRLVTIEATAFSGDTPVAQSRVWGQAGQVVSTTLEFEGITAVEFSSDSAALVDLGFVPLAQEATVGWQQIPGFTYPMRLPVTQRGYPCTPGVAEDLEAARTLARQRILYGDPKQLTAPPTLITNAGTVSVVNGSPIVTGNGTNWDANLAGAMFQVKGDTTAYLVVQVISPAELVLSRNYQGASASNAAYALNQDAFGQYYDHLLQLVIGGSAAGPMASRMLPAPIYTAGTVSVSQDSPNVTGNGTAWGANLVGLAFQLSGEQTLYTIVAVPSPTQFTLDRGYQGNSQAGQAYQVIATLSGQQANPAGGAPPRLVQQRVIDTVMLSTLQPAVAQMTGLYWVDQQAQPGTAYDYLVVADGDGSGNLDPAKILTLLQQNGFQMLDGCIVFNKQAAPAFPLDAPQDLRIYALPGSTRLNPDGTFQDASNNAGLRWNLATTDAGVLLPGGAIMYHLWRAGLGNGTTPAAPGSYALLTQGQPVLVAVSQLVSGMVPQYPPGWPPFQLYFIDNALPDGWYSYQASGIDIFGRHSPNSAAGAWYEWVLAPGDQRPWYYIDPPGDNVINSSAVRLLNKRVPPPPTGVEAYALDYADPFLLRDDAYNAWFATLSSGEQQKVIEGSLIGLRVRWAWTQKQAQQAPATSEFRIYYHPGRMNVLTGQISSVSFADGTGGAESYVQTDIANTRPANAYAGARLRAGSDSFAIVGSDAGSSLRLRVRNIGPSTTAGSIAVTNGSTIVIGQNTNWDFALTGLSLQLVGEQTVYSVLSVNSATQLTLSQAYSGATVGGKAYTIFDIVPPSHTACTLVIPPTYDAGTVTLVTGSPRVTGSNDSNWNPTLVGMPFQVAGEQAIYTIVSVDAPTQLTLDRAYEGASAAEKLYAIRFPLFVDYRVPASWEERYYVVGYNDHVTLTTDDQGQPLRLYELLLPFQGDTYRQGVLLSPTLSEPIAYAGIGVSAADNEPTTQDDSKWASGRLGNRPGNEGRVGSPATIFRVLRERPPVPPLPPPLDPEHSTATAADGQGHSFYTYRWLPAVNLRTHIYRGLDETLFQVDWTQRPRALLDTSQPGLFPDPAIEPRWTQTLRQQVANELNGLNNFTHDTTGTAQALASYRGLSNNALRILGGLPGNKAAFTQLTIQPLENDDPANADRRGPDTPSNYMPNPNLRAYVDTLNGLTSNRYLYRAMYVDRAHNQSGTTPKSSEAEMSLASVPVLVPKVVPPRTPTFTKVLGGDRQIILRWASNREPDLKEYRVYRTDNAAAAGNLQQMTLVHTEMVPDGDPADRPTEVVWTDTSVPGLASFFYRMTAVDAVGNVSSPTVAISARAYRVGPPDAPVLISAVWVAGTSAPFVRLTWMILDSIEVMVQRLRSNGTAWTILSGWLPGNITTFDDMTADPTTAYTYRLKGRDVSGWQSDASAEIVVAPGH